MVECRALAQVVVVGLVVGAGLPALFAVGVRAIAGRGSRDAEGRIPRSRRIVAGVCFGVVVAAVVCAVAFIAGGGH